MSTPNANSLAERPIRKRRAITVTVGPDPDADFHGDDDRIIQAAMEYVARHGGGIVRLGPGCYDLHNALFPPPGAALRGSGKKTVLRKTPGTRVRCRRSADWYEYAVHVEDAAGFRVGGGVSLTSDRTDFPQTRLFTIMAIDGDRLYLDARTERNFWTSENAVAATTYSLIHGLNTNDVVIEDLVLDGNAAENPPLNGNYGAGVFLQYCNNWRFENVTCRNYNGDGFSFQVCDDIRFDQCRALNNANLGFHPGSGSQRSRFFDCESRGNDIGLFWCWGACDGRAEQCRLIGNRKFGTSIGHRDTDNLLVDCVIDENGEAGVLFREEAEAAWTPDRNRIERCRVRNNGECGVDIRGSVHDATIVACEFAGTGPGRQPTGIRIGERVGAVNLDENVFHGEATPVCDLRAAGN